MAAPAGAVPMDTTTVQPTETQGGLPGVEDKIVRELDVYLVQGQGELGHGAQTYLLQFPLRPPWRPYHSEEPGLLNVALKSKVKKLQCEVPLDTRSRNYNTNVEPSKMITSVTLQSARLEQRTSFAAGFVEDDRLLLFPVDEALQLRPSLAHLDKDKELSAAAKKRQQAEEEDAKPAELMQLTVQVKRRETEQQMESRLRSYAHLAAQEEADPWVPLEYHGESSGLAATVWQKLATVEGKGDAPVTLSRQQYLDAIIPDALVQGGEETANWAAAAGTAGADLGKPSAAADAVQRGGGGGDGQPAADAAVSEDLHAGIAKLARVMLKGTPVTSIELIRDMLARQPDLQLKGVAAGASDAALHAAVIATGEVTHLRKAFFLTRLGNTALDPLRDIVIELLKGQEQLRRSDIVEAAKQKGLSVSDTLYSKVVKELCTSRGSIWSLKS